MSDNWKELWLKNYNNEGDCKGLEEYVERLDFGAKKDAFYLPWAVVERIFRLQDGEIEILKTNDKIVEMDKVSIAQVVDSDGVITENASVSFFVNVKVKWQGREHVEKYPLQDSNGRALVMWNQNDINRAIQRAKVKAIAIISGIGYKLFEKNDMQFEIEDTPRKSNTKVEQTEIKAKELKEQTEVKTKELKEQTEVKTKELKEKIEIKEEQKIEEKQIEPQETETVNLPPDFNRVDIENNIKTIFLSGNPEKVNIITETLKQYGVLKIQKLTDEQIYMLYQSII